MKKEPIPIIKLSDAEKKQLYAEIAAFYLDERGDEIGIIEQQQILDLFMNHLAPVVYNRALDDAKRWYTEQLNNMDSDYYMLYKE